MNHYTEDKKQAEDYAKRAITLLHKEGLPPTPELYELWYIFFARQNQDVRTGLEDVQKSDEGITHEACMAVYQRYLSKERGEETVRKAGEKINATIDNMTSVVNDVRDATSSYGARLDSVKSRVSQVESVDDLQMVVESVMNDTVSMLSQNQRLEQQLSHSAKAMENLKEELEVFRREAITDGLTGLLNRKAFDTEMERIVTESEENNTAFSLMIGDIDHFKSFNDSFGHQVGDQVLRLVAKTLTDGVKGRDIVARYGGEEFVIILPETNLQAGVIVGNALRKAIAAKEVVNRTSGEKIGRITMSLGVAQYHKGETVEELIERADAALYTAKHNGRNQVAAAPLAMAS